MGSTIGQRIREWRERAGFSQEELARRAGLTLQSVYRYESDRVEPKISNVTALAAALDCDARLLMFGDPVEDEDDGSLPPNLKRFLATELGKSATPEQRDMLVQMVRHYHGDTTVAGWRTAFTGLFEMRPDDPDDDELEGLMKVER